MAVRLAWGIAVRNAVLTAMAVALALAACAGRDPQPIATVQPQDAFSDCTMIRAEIEGNNQKAKQLADEQGLKVAQNVGAGIVGLVIWPVWFGMDFKGAAGQEVAALQARQEYLTQLATERCRPGYRPPPPPGGYYPPPPPYPYGPPPAPPPRQ
jgi:ABC-type transporter MlaC component